MDRSLCARATSDDLNPTPGWMYNDITKITFTSQSDCEKLMNYLIGRLKKNSSSVKYKALLILKHVLIHGALDFKLELQRNTEKIKECLSYRGAPDPLRGDEPYRLVRETAKEVMDSVFETTQPDVATMSSSRIEGFGSGAVSSISPTNRWGPAAKPGFPNKAGPESKKMTGFGNPEFDHSAPVPSFMDRVKDQFEKVAATKFTGPPVPTSPAAPGFNYATNRGPTAISSGSFSQPSLSETNSFRGATGNVWGNSGISNTRSRVGSTESDSSRRGSHGRMGRAGGANTDGSYEKHLVDELTEPGGMRAVPPKDKLDHFCSLCQTLNADIVGTVLLNKLDDENWQVRAKALSVIEALAKNGVPHMQQFFWENADVFEELQQSSQTVVSRAATKAMQALGLIEKQTNPTRSVPKTTDLLGGLDDFSPQATETSKAPAQTDLFSLLNTTISTKPENTRPQVDDIFGGLSIRSDNSTSNSNSNSVANSAFPDLFQPSPISPGTNFSTMDPNPMLSFSQPNYMSTPGNSALSQHYNPITYTPQGITPMQTQIGAPTQTSFTQVSAHRKSLDEGGTVSSSGFGFMNKKEDDSFSFVQDAISAMKR